MKKIAVLQDDLKNKIYTIRNTKVMLDKDLAEIYKVETKRINEAVKNNQDKFPSDFYFELSTEEFDDLRTKFPTANFSKTRFLPKAFTENGIYMLATILKSKVATEVTLALIRTFSFLRENLYLANPETRFLQIEKKLLEHDACISSIQKALSIEEVPKSGVFYNGKIFDAYVFVSKLIKSAKKQIILIDNYVDESVILMLGKNEKASICIYTQTITKTLSLDIQKYNSQNKNQITIKQTNSFHDRFLIIDNDIYHIGASIKDLGKKTFAFSKMDNADIKLLERL